MSLEQRLKAIIESAANDFDETVNRDPVVPSSEDGTARGDYLDAILAQQRIQRQQLWRQLHELEDQYRERGLHILCQPSTSPDTKKRMTLEHEEKELRKELKKQVEAVEDIAQLDEPVSELRFKEELSNNVTSMRALLDFLEEELNQTKDAVEREGKAIEESANIGEALTKKLEKLQESVAHGHPQIEAREKFIKINDHYRAVIEHLIDFLDEFFPPHPVDKLARNPDTLGNAPVREEEQELSELKFIVEDLMNLLVIHPDNPYMRLEPGTYWTPYVETLVKAGVAKRHPDDPNQLRLVDFRA